MSSGNYPDLTKIKKILIVKTRLHGDVLISSVVFSNLKKALPQASIDAFIYAATYPMLEGHPDINQFYLYDPKVKKKSFLKGILNEIKFLLKIRAQKYDLVINLTEGDRGALIAFFANSTYRVGFDPEKTGFLGKEKIYTHLVKNCPTPRHMIDRHLDVLRVLGIFPQEADKKLTFHLPPQSLEKGKELSNFILVHPTSHHFFKCVPVKLMAETVDFLSSQGFQVVLTSGPEKRELAMVDEILKLATAKNVISFAGKTSLKELGALISRASALVCVDSVPLHLASVFKTPLLVFFGPTSEVEWGPWRHPRAEIVRQNWKCRSCHLMGCGGSKVSDCLTSLSFEQVKESFERLNLKVVAEVNATRE